MVYEPHNGDRVRVFVRKPFKEHIGSPMEITDVHYNGRSLHYVNAVDTNGCDCELSNKLFEIKLFEEGIFD